MSETHRTYLPAAGHDWALPLYDPLVRLLGGDAARRRLVEQAALQPGQRVLEIGCGTGTLLLMIKQHPGVEVVGLDPDPKALALARRKAEKAGATVSLDQGFADELPYPDASFDRAFSSFMFHHLPAEVKEKTLREARRVLRPGGSLYLLDFRGPKPSDGFFARLISSSHHLRDNTEERVLGLMKQAGFADPATVDSGKLLLASTTYYRASTS